MDGSSQELMKQPSQEEMSEGLPEGYPPKRESTKPSDPLPSEMQQRLDEIGKQNLGGPRQK